MTTLSPADRERRIDRLCALFLLLGTAVLVGVTASSIGFTRDEGYYFHAAEDYYGWFKNVWQSATHGHLRAAFQQPVIDRYWGYNHEHPVLMKALFGLSWGLLHEEFHVIALNSTAFRLPSFFMAGLSVALVFLVARRFLRRETALFAAVMWLSLPHPFWHMHLACFDIPVCTAHLWLVYAYIRGRETVRGGALVGVAFGLAAAVKHNVIVAPFVFFIQWVLTEAPPVRFEKGLVRWPIPLAFISMAVLGPIVFVLHWPYLWPDVTERVLWYFRFHLQHEHYPILYFGDLLTQPPFPRSFIYVMTAVTVPTAALFLFVAGALLAVVASLRLVYQRMRGSEQTELTLVPFRMKPEESSGWGAMLLFGNAAFPFSFWLQNTTPIFGGTKHWMNGLPFLCILGAWAAEEGIARAQLAWARARRWKIENVLALAGALTVIPGFWITARVHPYGLSAYNELVGFARGAANVGFQRTFWGHEPRRILPAINARTPLNGTIFFGDTNWDDYRMYVRDGLLRRDINYANAVSGASVTSVQPQGEFKDEWLNTLNVFHTTKPDEVVHVEGVPLITVTFAPPH